MLASRFHAVSGRSGKSYGTAGTTGHTLRDVRHQRESPVPFRDKRARDRLAFGTVPERGQRTGHPEASQGAQVGEVAPIMWCSLPINRPSATSRQRRNGPSVSHTHLAASVAMNSSTTAFTCSSRSKEPPKRPSLRSCQFSRCAAISSLICRIAPY